MMTWRRALALLIVLAVSLALPSMAPATRTAFAQSADAPWLVVEVHDQDGVALAYSPVVWFVGGVKKPAKYTDGQGSTTISISKNQGATRLRVVGWPVDAECPAGRAWIETNSEGIIEVHAEWTPGTPIVTIYVRTSQFAPTPTPTQGPTFTPWPTATDGPTPTMPPTPTPWDEWYDASAVIEINQGNPPGSYDIQLLDIGGVHVYMQTHGSDYPHGCGPDCTTQWGWARLYFECEPENPPGPPTVVTRIVTRIVTATPGAPTVAATPTKTGTRTATAAPTLTAVPSGTAVPTLTIEELEEEIIFRYAQFGMHAEIWYRRIGPK